MTKPILFHEVAYESPRPAVSVMRGEGRWLPDFSRHGRILYEGRLLLMAILIIAVIAAASYATVSRPTYEASMLIHVEADGGSRKQPATVLGELAAMFRGGAVPDEESELIRSRMVVSRAVDAVGGFIEAQPDYFPVFGRWMAQRKPDALLRPGYLGYAWGAEAMEVRQFTLPGPLLNRRFVIVAQAGGAYRLEDENGHAYGVGKPEVPLVLDGTGGPIELLVGRLEAPEGVRFFLERKSRLALIEAVQANLSVQGAGRQGGVIRVGLISSDPFWAQSVLAEIGKQYLAQNKVRGVEETDAALAFLEEQLPRLKSEMQESELRYSRFRNSKGTVDPGEESRVELQRLAAARARKADLEQKRADLLVRFTPNHPVVIGTEMQLRDANMEIRSISNQMKSMPQVDTELAKLAREMKASSELYASQLDVARQLRLAKASRTSNVRLIDLPMLPERPVSAGPARIVGIGLLLGLLAGAAAVYLRHALARGIVDPFEIEDMINLPVYAALPMSRQQKALRSALRARLRDSDSLRRQAQPLLARDAPQDEAVESLRHFRAVFQYARKKSANNISLFISPTAGNGKSFVSANLAALLGAGGKRVMLIDADLRNGDLHAYFQLAPSSGFADLLTGAAQLDSAIQYSVVQNVDLLPSSASAHPSELLLHPNLLVLLRILALRYDVVLINGAPVLEVSDALALGVHAGAIYVVAQAGVSTMRDIGQTVRVLRQAGLTASGCLLNGVKPTSRQRGRRYGYGKRWNTQYLPAPVNTEEPTLSIQRS